MVVAAKTPGSPSSPERFSLSADTIVAAATELIERDGIDRFTMRALGRELGVSAMAVYGYFKSRDEVLVAVKMRFMDSMDTLPIPGERWDDTLRRTMTSIMRNDLMHPELAMISTSPEVGAGGLERHTERIVSMHMSQGIPEPIFAQLWAMVDAYLTGFVDNAIMLKAAQVLALNSGENAKPEPQWKRIVDSAYTEEAFAEGIEIIINGVRALAAPDPCEWRTPLP